MNTSMHPHVLLHASPGALIKLYRDQIRRTTGAESTLKHFEHEGEFYRRREDALRAEPIACGKSEFIKLIHALLSKPSFRDVVNKSKREEAKRVNALQWHRLRLLDYEDDGKYSFECMTCKGTVTVDGRHIEWKFCPHCGIKFGAQVLDSGEKRWERRKNHRYEKHPIFEFVMGPDPKMMRVYKANEIDDVDISRIGSHITTTREYDTKEQIWYACRYAHQEARKWRRPLKVRIKPTPVNPFFLK